MSWADVWDFVWKAIVVLGTFGAFAAAIAAFVAKLFADRSIEKHKAALGQETERLKGELSKETETHKLKLRKQEILFQMEFEAAAAFFPLHRSIRPKQTHPDMDWDEATQAVVESFTDTAKALDAFVAKYGPALSESVRTELDRCIAIVSANQFAPSLGGDEMIEAKTDAEIVLKMLEALEAQFITELRS